MDDEPGLKENLSIQAESAKLAAIESVYGIRGFIKAFPRWKRIFMYVLLIALIPLSVAAYFGFRYYATYSLRDKVVEARKPFIEPSEAKVLTTELVKYEQANLFGAYARISNPNLDLSATSVPYSFDFYDSSGVLSQSIKGETFFLPNEQKYIVVPRLQTEQIITSVKLTIGKIDWQKKLALDKVDLKTPSPLIYDSLNPLTFTAEGSVVNNSPYRLKQIRLVFLVYDQSGKITALSQRDEYDIASFARRAYKQNWPNLTASAVSKVIVQAETNTLLGDNLIPEDPQLIDDLQISE